ncbi:MAG TPA: helix-turn-helix domain-containing protein [Candidatus Cybelea sp.]
MSKIDRRRNYSCKHLLAVLHNLQPHYRASPDRKLVVGTQQEIAERSGYSLATVQRVLEHLTRLGYVIPYRKSRVDMHVVAYELKPWRWAG